MSKLLFAIVIFSVANAKAQTLPETTSLPILDSDKAQNSSAVAEDLLVKQVYELIEHFKQEDPIGLPLAPLPDPFDVPDVNQRISMANLQMRNAKLAGISQFRIKFVSVEIKEMVAKCGILFENLKLTGDYSLSTFMMNSKGPFTIQLKDVYIEGSSMVTVEKDGKLRTDDVKIDITFKDMVMDFKNLGFLASIFQGIANSASNVIFDSIKPNLLKDAYVKIKAAIDENLIKITGDALIPNSISPIDSAIAEARKQVRERGYDPFHVEDYNHPGVFGGKIYNTWVYGISSFYRVGEMALNIKDNNAIVVMEIGTQELSGTTSWEVSIAKGMITRGGNLQFTVQHIKVLFEVTQPLDLSRKLQINDLQLDLGNIQIRSSGLGTADYLVEFFINVIPNLLRYQIMDALEKPMMKKIQGKLGEIDVENMIKEKFREYRETGSVKINLNVEL